MIEPYDYEIEMLSNFLSFNRVQLYFPAADHPLQPPESVRGIPGSDNGAPC